MILPIPARVDPNSRTVAGALNDAGERGFTLVEAVIAMLVTVVALVGIAGMFTVAMKTNASSRNMTTATTFAQDKIEQLGATSFQRLVDPSKMTNNPGAHGSDDAYIVGSLERDAKGNDGSFYFDKIILAGRDDIEPEGTITVVRPDGTAETRRPDGTVSNSNPFGDDRITYSRRWVIMSSNEEDPADRRLTIAVRVKSENATTGKSPELVDLYTVMTNQ
ncbi:MAG TPA: prepilin-type N-terminal cleavage/methylation domain-containing protein [Blastocatellia bacterium]|nr:prepilin-type N-terminal cleavage/methylation domain-containing protein [Blastocatellia bacterium]